MKTGTQVKAAMLMFAAPVAAYAQGGAPHIILESLVGGAIGGFIGAALACWLCKRACGSKDETNPRR